jgi:hypothetical protein
LLKPEIFKNGYSHKVPLAFKFKEKHRAASLGIKSKINYKEKGASFAADIDYNTKVLGKQVTLNFSGNQFKARVEGSPIETHGLALRHSLNCSGTRNLRQLHATLGIGLKFQFLFYTGCLGINQNKNCMISQKVAGKYKGLSFSQAFQNDLAKKQNGFKTFLGFREKSLEASFEIAKDKKKPSSKFLAFSSLVLSLVYDYSKNLQLGLQLRENQDKNKRKILIGFSSNAGDEVKLKGKIDQNGKVSGRASYNLSKKATGIICLQARTMNKNKPVTPICKRLSLPFSVGLQFEWKN